MTEAHDNDVCMCGDYRHQHVGGTGRCKLQDLCTPGRCQSFRLFRGHDAAPPAPSFECEDCPMADPGECLKAGYCHHRDAHKWRLPHRSMDNAGSPLSAHAVGWGWINAIADEEKAMSPDPGGLSIEHCPLEGAGLAIALYQNQTPIAVATIYRDMMNFAVLVRWRHPDHCKGD